MPPGRSYSMYATRERQMQGGSNGVKKCDMEDPNVGESIIGFKMDINNM